MEHKCFFNECVFVLIFFTSNDEVDRTADRLSSFKISPRRKLRIVVTVEQVSANRELFEELWVGNIRVAVVLSVTNGIIVHCLLQGRSNTHIVNDKSAFLITEDTINTSDCLHEIVALHRLVNIHSGKGRHIKACEPHIYNDCNFKRTVVVFEFLCKLVLVVLVADYLTPFFRVVVAGSHYNRNFFRPSRAQL